jgi:hypothetical protein
VHKSFKCLDVTEGCVYISRDAVFDETVYPFNKLNTNAGSRLRSEILLLPSHSQPSCLPRLGDEILHLSSANAPIIPVPANPSSLLKSLQEFWKKMVLIFTCLKLYNRKVCLARSTMRICLCLRQLHQPWTLVAAIPGWIRPCLLQTEADPAPYQLPCLWSPRLCLCRLAACPAMDALRLLLQMLLPH